MSFPQFYFATPISFLSIDLLLLNYGILLLVLSKIYPIAIQCLAIRSILKLNEWSVIELLQTNPMYLIILQVSLYRLIGSFVKKIIIVFNIFFLIADTNFEIKEKQQAIWQNSQSLSCYLHI